MHRAFSKWLLGLSLGWLLVGVYGCAGQKATEGWSFWPFGNAKSDHVDGLVSPPERIAAIRKAAKEAASAGTDQQERVARELAGSLSQETDPVIRLEIIRAIGKSQTPTSSFILREALKDSDAEVRVAACKAWGSRRGPEASGVLGEVLLSDIELDVRLAAARAIGQTGDRGAVAALAKALDDRNPAVQFYAVDSLRKVSGQDYGNDLDKWRQYAKGETPAPNPPPSLAERFRGLF